MPEMIDRQKVLEIAMCYCPDDDGCCSKAGHDIREMLDEIEALPTITQEVLLIPKEVSATDIDKLAEMIKGGLLQAYPNDAMLTTVRQGRWIPTEYDSFADGAPVWDKWECSECGHEHNGEEDTLTAFCPDCGTKLDANDTDVGGKGWDDNAESD